MQCGSDAGAEFKKTLNSIKRFARARNADTGGTGIEIDIVKHDHI